MVVEREIPRPWQPHEDITRTGVTFEERYIDLTPVPRTSLDRCKIMLSCLSQPLCRFLSVGTFCGPSMLLVQVGCIQNTNDAYQNAQPHDDRATEPFRVFF